MAQGALQLVPGGRIPLWDLEEFPQVEVIDLLGAGAFGTVWKVKDIVTGKILVLKVISGVEPDSTLAQRIRNEASVNIASDYIISVVGLSQWDPGTFLILFDYFAGQTLSKTLPHLSLTNRNTVYQQILEGVRDAHRCNVIHRDLKPDNILISEELQVKIIDFGISRFKDKGVTQSDEILGTPAYTAPEVFREGSKNADARVDIYSLGHLLFEMSTGKQYWRYQRWSSIEDFVAFLRQDPPPSTCIDCSDFHCPFNEKADAVLPMMVKTDPEERIGSAQTILEKMGYCPSLLPTPTLDFNLRYPMLIVESGTNKGARTVVAVESGQTLRVGRADLAGSDLSISSRHLEFSRSGHRYYVRDVGSKNGTLLKGSRLNPHDSPTELHHEDRIKVGDIFLRFAFIQ